MNSANELLIIFVCLACSAFFSGSETALLRLGKHQIEADLEGSHGLSARAARELVTHTGKLLVTILLGNNVVNILAAAVASTMAVRLLGEERGLIVSTIALTVVVLIFCEILPKAVAARSPRRASYAVALPLYLIHKLLRPVHWVFEVVIDPVVHRISGVGDGDEVGPARSDELLELARRLAVEPPSATPAGILGNTAHAVSRTVAEVMTPRIEVFSADVATPPGELFDTMLQDRYSRVPVWSESIDSVIGLVHFRDVAGLVRDGGTDLRTIVHPVLRVPERKPILDLLADMQREAAPLAIVKDEFGTTMGLVTQEDVLEELVGELRDEFDGEELDHVRELEDGSYEAAGEITVLDFNRVSGWSVPGGRGQSLGGLAFTQLGRPPKSNDSVDVGDFRIQILSARGTHIRRVRVSKLR